MRVLCACEESQAVCIEFRKLGHEAYSCDIQDCSGGHPNWHIKGDVLEQLDKGWDLMIAFPPCTYLTNAGARHLYKNHTLNIERYKHGMIAKMFFMALLECSYIPRIAVENPTPSKIYQLPKPSQTIQPWQFGHPYTKRTNLWLKNLPKLEPTEIVEPVATFCPSGSYSHKHGDKHKGVFSRDRARNRSKTFSGIAAAIASQWGKQQRKEGNYAKWSLSMS